PPPPTTHTHALSHRAGPGPTRLRADYLVQKHLFHVKDLVITKAEAAAAMASAAEMEAETNAPAPAPSAGGAGGTGVVVKNPIRGVSRTSKGGAVILAAASWFELTGAADPRATVASSYAAGAGAVRPVIVSAVPGGGGAAGSGAATYGSTS